MGAAYTSFMDTKPSCLEANFLTWCQRLVQARIARCPVTRTTTYYISNSTGNDSNAGTITAPWKTLAKVQAHISGAGSGGDIAYLFKSGDEWTETTGIDCTSSNTTFASYGTGAKPLFNAFATSIAGDEGAFESAPNQNVMKFTGYTGTQQVRWVGDRTRPYTLVTSIAACQALAGSWYISGADLYIRPYGDESETDYTDTFWEAVGIVNDCAIEIQAAADGCRLDNLRADGWGIWRASPITQTMGFQSRVTGTNEVVMTRLEVYFSSTHCIAQYAISGAGGIATFQGCKAGLTVYNLAGGGESVFNTYAVSGSTAETIFDACETVYGTVPDSAWVTAGNRCRAYSLYGHNGANTTHRLFICSNHITRANTWGAEAAPQIDGYQKAETSIDNIVTWFINDLFEENNYAGGGSYSSNCGSVYINCKHLFKPRDFNSTVQALGTYAGGVTDYCTRIWFLNCIIQLNLTYQTDNTWLMLFNDTSSGTANNDNIIFQNGHFNIKNGGGTTGMAGFSHDGNARNWTSAPNDHGVSLWNSIITRESGTFILSSTNGNSTTRLKNNALFDVYVPGSWSGSGFTNDAAEVNLGAAWVVGAIPGASDSIRRAGTSTGTLALKYDFNGRLRHTTTPSIGPFEYTGDLTPAGRFLGVGSKFLGDN